MSLEEIIAQAGAEVEAKRREGEEIIRDILRVNGICDDYQPPQRKANPNISFRPLVRQGNSDSVSDALGLCLGFLNQLLELAQLPDFRL